MIHLIRSVWIATLVLSAMLLTGGPAMAIYIPDKFFAVMYTDYGDMPQTAINHPPVEDLTPIPNEYVLHETNISGSFPPVSEEFGAFERNEHQIRFATNGETANGQSAGHQFQRREAWDFAFDVKIETPNVAPRKEAGIYFKSFAGNALFVATSNDGFYSTGPGVISTAFENVMPAYFFSGGSGPLGDYNHNRFVDAADYTVWRDTLDSTTDLRANGNNEGASEDHIDQADYDVWKKNFGEGSDGVRYNVGDTLRMRLIYTPPILFDDLLPDVEFDTNVMTPGTMEYIISMDGGPQITSGPLEFTNSWQGIPNDTLIMLRVQNMGTAAVVNDSSIVTFSNFDFNGDLPGSGIGSLAGAGTARLPEPSALVLAAMGLVGGSMRRRIYANHL